MKGKDKLRILGAVNNRTLVGSKKVVRGLNRRVHEIVPVPGIRSG